MRKDYGGRADLGKTGGGYEQNILHEFLKELIKNIFKKP